jgi:hypothetical protein
MKNINRNSTYKPNILYKVKKKSKEREKIKEKCIIKIRSYLKKEEKLKCIFPFHSDSNGHMGIRRRIYSDK